MTVRWGLIGAGDIVRKRVAAALRDTADSELVAVSRRDSTQAKVAAKEMAARLWFGDWRELVRSPEIDAVYIATPVYLHAEQTTAAARAGKHVLCEKPMAMDAAECDSMIAACAANNIELGIAYYRHFYPIVNRVKKIIASGEIGKVSVVQINAFEHFAPPADDPRHWLIDKTKSGGGPMIDFGCHRLEVLTNLFGKAWRVQSMLSNDVLGREVEDTAVALLQFDNGVLGSITVTHAAVEPQDTLDIYGTEGSIHVPILNRSEMIVVTGAWARRENHPPPLNMHQPLIEDFVEAVLTDRSPAIDGNAGRYVSVLLDEIYDSVTHKSMGAS